MKDLKNLAEIKAKISDQTVQQHSFVFRLKIKKIIVTNLNIFLNKSSKSAKNYNKCVE